MNKKSMFKSISTGIDELIKQGMPAKRSDFVVYFDKKEQNTIFALALPHYVRNVKSIFDNHLHVPYDKQFINAKPEECVNFVDGLLMAYFDQAADIISDAQQTLQFNSEERRNLAQDATYVLKKYLEWKKFLSITPSLLDAYTNLIVLGSYRQAMNSGYFKKENYDKVLKYGAFFGSYFGNLLPLISDESTDLNDVFETLIKTNTTNLTPETIPSGFAKETFCQQDWFI